MPEEPQIGVHCGPAVLLTATFLGACLEKAHSVHLAVASCDAHQARESVISHIVLQTETLLRN